MTDKTEDQIAMEKAEAERVKAEAKALKEQKKAQEKAAKEAEAAAKKEAKAKAAQDAKDAKAAAKQAKVEAREAAKAAAKQRREEGRMPEQNGIRRPKADTLCGRAWAIFDDVSKRNGTPASIGEAMAIARSQNLNEANVRTEYARWRKFYGISGRIESPAKAPAEAA